MKFAHISDLHLGKRIYQFSMVEEQKYILQKIVEIVREEKVEGIFIAGDVYDKIYPSAEAVALFDTFLVELAKEDIKVFVISGNHDSPERIAFLGELTKKAGVYLAPVYKGRVEAIDLEDEYGKIHIYLLPFVKPIHVRHFFPEESVTNYTDAIQVVVKKMGLNLEERNVLLAHQFVTGAMRSESEEISVGGLDHVEVTALKDFDYTALGHIHRPQNMGNEKVRYSGTPLKYSFSEWKDEKSITIVELKEKGDLQVTEIPLKPLHDMVKIQGTFLELMNPDNFPNLDAESYLHVTLQEEQICDVCHKMWQLGWVAANDGNVSVKMDDGTWWITPSGISKSFITPDKLIRVDKDMNVVEGPEGYKPSSEMKMHMRCYEERDDVGAVVHAHPPTATGFAVANKPLDQYSMIETVIMIGSIPVTPYGTPSTYEVPEAIAPYLKEHDVLLLQNHGALTVGCDLITAYYRMETLELFAKISLTAHLLGGAQEIPKPQIDKLLDLRENYYHVTGKHPGYKKYSEEE